MPLVAVQRIRQVVRVDLAPFAAEAYFRTGIYRLLALLEARVELVAVGVELVETVASQEVQLKVIIPEYVYSACRSAEEDVSAVIQVQRYEIELALIAAIVECQVQIGTKAKTTPERRSALGCIEERYFRDFVLGANGVRTQDEKRDIAQANSGAAT